MTDQDGVEYAPAESGDASWWWDGGESRARPDDFPACCDGCVAALACVSNTPILYFLVCPACGDRLAAYLYTDGRLRALDRDDPTWRKAMRCPNVPAYEMQNYDDCEACQPMTDDDGNIIPPEETDADL